jgi:hypothetical protein
MSKNDDKIKEVLSQIEKKQKEIGTKPRAAWKSNGIIKVADGHININTINNLDLCVHAAAEILQQLSHRKEAAQLLGVPESSAAQDDYLDDLKLRASMIKYDVENKKLNAMEEKLKALRSEDAKTADAIADVLKGL